jgi:hypothetical protein
MHFGVILSRRSALGRQTSAAFERVCSIEVPELVAKPIIDMATRPAPTAMNLFACRRARLRLRASTMSKMPFHRTWCFRKIEIETAPSIFWGPIFTNNQVPSDPLHALGGFGGCETAVVGVRAVSKAHPVSRPRFPTVCRRRCPVNRHRLTTRGERLAGLPVVTDDGVRLEPPARAKRLQAANAGYLFLDELLTSPSAVPAAVPCASSAPCSSLWCASSR